jgi:very-short-patch-repair endonuclease
MPTLDQLIARLAERQHGVFTFDQALSCGFTPKSIRSRVAQGRWVRVHKGVYTLRGTVRSFEQATMIRVSACGSGAVAFRRTAAALFAIEGITPDVVEVAVGRHRRPRLAHRCSTLRHSDVTMIGVIPATKPERTMIDLAPVLAPDPLEDALDDTIRRRLVRPHSLQERLEQMDRRGCTGLGLLLELVRTRTTANVPGSGRENVVRRALKRAGLPEPVRQYRIHDADGRFVARPDLCYPDRRLYIEYDGGHHESLRQRRSDLDRQNRLTALGWRPLRFTRASLRGPMSAIVEVVRDSWDTHHP